MFTVNYRDCVREDALKLATSDRRVTAGAVVGSLALDEGDRWSDLDLTFAVAEGVAVRDVLEDWTRHFAQQFGAVDLFDAERHEYPCSHSVRIKSPFSHPKPGHFLFLLHWALRSLLRQ